MPESEMPIFTRSYDLLVWLLNASNHFPRANYQSQSPLVQIVLSQAVRNLRNFEKLSPPWPGIEIPGHPKHH